MSVTTRPFAMTIDGQEVHSDATFGVINPANGSIFAQAPECTAEQLTSAVNAALGAGPTWRRDERARRDALTACADVIEANSEELARIVTREQGKPIDGSRGEARGAAHWLRKHAEFPLPHEVIRDDESAYMEVRGEPFGVVAAIVPWNYPLLLAATKIAPALLTGNTMVLKPSPYTPLSALRLGELLSDVLPPGVLNIVSGGDELGAAITTHPAVRMISFTGSVATGKKVAEAAAPDLKRFVLELGGNDPAIVLEDADPDEIAEALFWEAFDNSGQVCFAVKRLYVHERIFPRLVDAIVEVARNVRMGDGMDAATQLGPLSNAPQANRVSELVEDARRSGARVVTGGTRIEGPGYFYAPTVVTDIAEDARLVQEEQFGPALPIMSFSNLDDAVDRANATHFGLKASVWTKDLDRGAKIAQRLEAGTTSVNKHKAMDAHVPFGGAKWSGIGYQDGRQGIESYCQLRVIEVDRT